MSNLNYIIYFIGIMVFALTYESVKQRLGGGFWFFISALSYLASLRALGYLLANKFNKPQNMDNK